MKRIVVGICAHVDAGKTTLAEALLTLTGTVRRQGRVDHQDTLLDHHSLERARGITIFANQAVFSYQDSTFTLLDTPGHVDFSTESERVMPVLDAAILVINRTDGVQAHTETLWHLLRRYHIPTILFVTKMDLPGIEQSTLLEDFRKRLDPGICAMQEPDALEEISLLRDDALNEYLDSGELSGDTLKSLFLSRLLFPCYFGSGLHLDGVQSLLDGLERFSSPCSHKEEFGARVFKISYDTQGNRLAHLKVTGGSLSVRDTVEYTDRSGNRQIEKVSQIRVYSGAKFDQINAAAVGTVCAVIGLHGAYSGLGLGIEGETIYPVLEPVYQCSVIPPASCDPVTLLSYLRLLEEEDPSLHVQWIERTGELRVRLMGEIQAQILKSTLQEKYSTSVTFADGRILYKETISDSVEGVGHFEPLRHYAEVHLRLSPLERGAGLMFDSAVSTDLLDENWQRLVLSHLQEKQHLGVLTGSPITDMRITLCAGRAHEKHTEGGDFRQATYRALRQGLMQTKSVLLEPYYRFRLAVPMEYYGRAVSDLRNMDADFATPEEHQGLLEIIGRSSIRSLHGYSQTVSAYTRGHGSLSCTLDGYDVCKDADSVIAELGYHPESDLENTPDSVFCAHGAGFVVKWDHVQEYMHLELTSHKADALPSLPSPKVMARNLDLDEKELQAIMLRYFGRNDSSPAPAVKKLSPASAAHVSLPIQKKQHLIVDGYNVIFAMDALQKLAKENLSLARSQFMDLVVSYCSYKGIEAVLVFDGYRVQGNPGENGDFHGLHVVYTKQDESADIFIQRFAAGIGKNETVRVVSSDSLVRLSALHSGVFLTSSQDFLQEIDAFSRQLSSFQQQLSNTSRTNIGEVLPPDIRSV